MLTLSHSGIVSWVKPKYIHRTSNDIHRDVDVASCIGPWLGVGQRESWEMGDSGEEEDTQWRQVISLYTRILITFAG